MLLCARSRKRWRRWRRPRTWSPMRSTPSWGCWVLRDRWVGPVLGPPPAPGITTGAPVAGTGWVVVGGPGLGGARGQDGAPGLKSDRGLGGGPGPGNDPGPKGDPGNFEILTFRFYLNAYAPILTSNSLIFGSFNGGLNHFASKCDEITWSEIATNCTIISVRRIILKVYWYFQHLSEINTVGNYVADPDSHISITNIPIRI